MTPYRFGPRAARVLEALRQRILDDDLPAGTKLPSHADLAATYGVAPLTLRNVLAQLELEGLVRREQGRGTFVRRPVPPTALVVSADPGLALDLAEFLRVAQVRPLMVATPPAALEALGRERSVALVMAELSLPDPPAGREFVRTVRQQWPDLPVVAIAGATDDLASLLGFPESPVLVVAKPLVPRQIAEAVRLAMAATGSSRPRPTS